MENKKKELEKKADSLISIIADLGADAFKDQATDLVKELLEIGSFWKAQCLSAAVRKYLTY